MQQTARGKAAVDDGDRLAERAAGEGLFTQPHAICCQNTPKQRQIACVLTAPPQPESFEITSAKLRSQAICQTRAETQASKRSK